MCSKYAVQILYKRKYFPSSYFFPFHFNCQQANIKLDEFKSLNYLSFNTTVFGLIQHKVKLIASEEGWEKTPGDKITL